MMAIYWTPSVYSVLMLTAGNIIPSNQDTLPIGGALHTPLFALIGQIWLPPSYLENQEVVQPCCGEVEGTLGISELVIKTTFPGSVYYQSQKPCIDVPA